MGYIIAAFLMLFSALILGMLVGEWSNNRSSKKDSNKKKYVVTQEWGGGSNYAFDIGAT